MTKVKKVPMDHDAAKRIKDAADKAKNPNDQFPKRAKDAADKNIAKKRKP